VIPPNEDCINQTTNPVDNSYFEGDVKTINYSGNHCGLLPLNSGNYWIYEDSIFDNSGNLKTVQLDTLSYTKTIRTPDNLIWWEGNKNVGLPNQVYSSNTAIYGLQRGFFIADSFYSKKEFYEVEKDSASYYSAFGDIFAVGKVVRKSELIQTNLGAFTNYILFEKYAPGYRRDRVYFAPGFGVIKYTSEYYNPPGPPSKMFLQIKSTLVGFHSQN